MRQRLSAEALVRPERRLLLIIAPACPHHHDRGCRVVDGSRSIRRTNFPKILGMIQNVSALLPLTEGGIDAGVVQFANMSATRIDIPLSAELDTAAFIAAVGAIQYLNVNGEFVVAALCV